MLVWLDKITHGYALITLIGIAVFLIIRVLFSLIITSCVKKKGYNELLCFFSCIIFGICGYIVAAALPDRKLRYEIEMLRNELSAKDTAVKEGLLADSNDKRSPAGTTAYMPRSIEDSAKTQNHAVERIKKYWTDADKRESQKESKQKKKKTEKPQKAERTKKAEKPQQIKKEEVNDKK